MVESDLLRIGEASYMIAGRLTIVDAIDAQQIFLGLPSA